MRAGDEKLVAALDHKPTRTNVEAERAVLFQLEAGCAAPIAAHAFIDDGLLFLDARVYAPDGASKVTSSHALYVSDSPTPAQDVAGRVSAELIALGAADIAPLDPSGPSVAEPVEAPPTSDPSTSSGTDSSGTD